MYENNRYSTVESVLYIKVGKLHFKTYFKTAHIFGNGFSTEKEENGYLMKRYQG